MKKSFVIRILAVQATVVFGLARSLAHADDPCRPPPNEVAKSFETLRQFDHLIAKDGVFQVKKPGSADSTSTEQIRYDVNYHIHGKKLLQVMLTATPTNDGVLVVKPLRMQDGAKLGLAFVMGAGGGLSCTYRVYDKGGHFSMRLDNG